MTSTRRRYDESAHWGGGDIFNLPIPMPLDEEFQRFLRAGLSIHAKTTFNADFPLDIFEQMQRHFKKMNLEMPSIGAREADSPEERYYRRAYSLYKRNRLDEAIAEIQFALPRVMDRTIRKKLLDTLNKCQSRKQKDTVRVTIDRGIETAKLEEYEAAATIFTHAMTQTTDPSLRIELLRLRSSAYWSLANKTNPSFFRQAHSDLLTLKSIDPSILDESLRYRLLYCLYATGKYEKCAAEAVATLTHVTTSEARKHIKELILRCQEELANISPVERMHGDPPLTSRQPHSHSATLPPRHTDNHHSHQPQVGSTSTFDTVAGRASEAYNNGDYRLAISYITDALQIPCSTVFKVSLLSNRAYAWSKLHERDPRPEFLQRALNDCSAVHQLLGSAHHFKTTILAANIYLRRGAVEEAVRLAKQALACASQREEHEQASEVLRSARAARPPMRQQSIPRPAAEAEGPVSPDEERVRQIITTMDSQSPHEILGVQLGATRAEITAAYHVLAKQYHPDKPGGDTRLFQRLDEAKRRLCLKTNEN